MNEYERAMERWKNAPLKTWRVRNTLTGEILFVEAKTKAAAKVQAFLRGVPDVLSCISVVRTKKAA